MNQKTVKLIRRYVRKTGWPYKETKKEYISLNTPQERRDYKNDLKKSL